MREKEEDEEKREEEEEEEEKMEVVGKNQGCHANLGNSSA